MSLAEIVATLRRRWYLFLPITLLSLVLGGYLYRTVPASYQSQSSVSLLDSTGVAKLAPTFGNPISNAGGSLIVTADVLIRTLQSSDSAKALAELGVTDPYTVGFTVDSPGPLLTLTVTGTGESHVLRETNALTQFAGEQLAALQRDAGVPAAYQVTAAPVVLPQQPVSELKSKYQDVAGTIIAGTVFAFLLCFVVDAWARVRRQRKGLPPAGSKRSARKAAQAPRERPGLLHRPLDATAVLTVYLYLALFIPSNLAVPALGGVGTPANCFALLGLIWYLCSWMSGRITAPPRTRSARLAMCVLAAAVLLAYIADGARSSSHEELLGADRGLIGLLVWVSLAVLTSAGISDRSRLDLLMRRLVVLGAIVAGLAFYDFFTASNIADSIQIPGLHASVTGIDAMDRGAFVRPRATTAQPLELAGLLSILLPFAIQQALDPVRRAVKLWRRWTPVVLIAGALPLTVSRTSIIGIGIVALVMLWPWRPQRRWTAIGVITCGMAGLKVMIPGLIGTIIGLFSSFLSNSDSSTQARTVKYAEILPYLEQRPLFGRGFGTFTPDLYFYTDNQYMLIAAEMGAMGLLALLVLCFTGIHHGGVIRRLARTEADRELGQAFLASALVTLVISATFDSLSFAMFSGVFFLLLGAGASYAGFLRRAGDAEQALAADPAARAADGSAVAADPADSADPADPAARPRSADLVEAS